MRVFGEGWAATTLARMATPVGQLCLYCEEPILAGDMGVEMPFSGPVADTTVVEHRECFLRSILGSVGHQQKRCGCYGGTEEDPPGMTRRDAAKAAVALDAASQSS